MSAEPIQASLAVRTEKHGLVDVPVAGDWQGRSGYAGSMQGDSPSTVVPYYAPGKERLEITREPIWEKQSKETAKAFALFEIYLQLGPLRTHRQVVEQANEKGFRRASGNTIGVYAATNLWTLRANAYDEHLRAIALASREEAIKDAAKRHVEAAVALQDVGIAKVAELKDDASQLSAGDARSYIVDGVKLERLALGLSDSNVAVRGDVSKGETDVAALLRDPEAVETMLLLAERLQAKQEESK